MESILIIDDDVELCKLIKKYLEKEQYNVIVKYNGKEGVRNSEIITSRFHAAKSR